MPHLSCYLTSIMVKPHHGPVIALFLCNFSSFFSYVVGIPVTNHFSLLLLDRYILAIQQIMILNFLRSLATMVITTESGQNSLKVIFTEQFLAKVAIFRCFDVCSVWPPQISTSSENINIRPVFPDYLSISYDYEIFCTLMFYMLMFYVVMFCCSLF